LLKSSQNSCQTKKFQNIYISVTGLLEKIAQFIAKSSQNSHQAKKMPKYPHQHYQMIRKNCPFWSKVAKTVAKPKNDKISTPKLKRFTSNHF
jgi:hypothetical protein